MRSTGRRADGRVRCLAIGWLIVVLLVGCSTGRARPNASPSPSPHPNRLTWAPPPCGDAKRPCIDLYLRNTGSNQAPVLDDNTDYRIHLPTSGPLVGGITITGGRHVQIIGGEIDLTYPCSNDESGCMGIYIAKKSPGAVFVEGVWIHNPARIGRTCPGGASSTSQTCSSGDGIDINTTANGVINVNMITLENIRVDGISGCSGYGDHADVFQPYQAPDDTIQIDRMTGVTNCQGFELDPDLAYSIWHKFPSITIENANVEITFNPYRKGARVRLVADVRDWLQVRAESPCATTIPAGLGPTSLRPQSGRTRTAMSAAPGTHKEWSAGETLLSMARSEVGRHLVVISYLLAPQALATCHLDTSGSTPPPSKLSDRCWPVSTGTPRKLGPQLAWYRHREAGDVGGYFFRRAGAHHGGCHRRVAQGERSAAAGSGQRETVPGAVVPHPPGPFQQGGQGWGVVVGRAVILIGQDAAVEHVPGQHGHVAPQAEREQHVGGRLIEQGVASGHQHAA